MTHANTQTLLESESEIAAFIRKSDERTAKIQALWVLEALPTDFPTDYSPEIDEKLQHRMRQHLTNLEGVFAEVESFPLVDRTQILANVEAAYIEFLQRLTPLVEGALSQHMHEPKIPNMDTWAFNLIMDAQAEIILSTPIWKLLKELFINYERYYNLFITTNTNLSQIVTDLELMVGDKVKEVTGLS